MNDYGGGTVLAPKILKRLDLMTYCGLGHKSSSAARVKLKWRAAASKTRKAFSGGNRLDMAIKL